MRSFVLTSLLAAPSPPGVYSQPGRGTEACRGSLRGHFRFDPVGLAASRNCLGMVKTDVMGYTVKVVAAFRSSPTNHVIEGLADHFGSVDHPQGSKTVTLTEHVAVADEADAVALVRSLVEDALPDGTRIVELSATADSPH
jgi:hypothetical protein